MSNLPTTNYLPTGQAGSLPTSRGFTMIELLLYAALASVILGSISGMYSPFSSARIKQQTISEVEQQGTQVLQMITQTIRNAKTITTPSIGASGASLVLADYVSGSNPTTFDLSSGVLRICQGASCTPVPLTSSNVTVSALSFNNLSYATTPGIITIQFVITYTNPSGRNEYAYTKTFYATASKRQPQ